MAGTLRFKKELSGYSIIYNDEYIGSVCKAPGWASAGKWEARSWNQPILIRVWADSRAEATEHMLMGLGYDLPEVRSSGNKMQVRGSSE